MRHCRTLLALCTLHEWAKHVPRAMQYTRKPFAVKVECVTRGARVCGVMECLKSWRREIRECRRPDHSSNQQTVYGKQNAFPGANIIMETYQKKMSLSSIPFAALAYDYWTLRHEVATLGISARHMLLLTSGNSDLISTLCCFVLFCFTTAPYTIRILCKDLSSHSSLASLPIAIVILTSSLDEGCYPWP